MWFEFVVHGLVIKVSSSKFSILQNLSKKLSQASWSPRVKRKCKKSLYLSQSLMDKFVDLTPIETECDMMASLPTLSSALKHQ